MSAIFLASACSEEARKDDLFGLCDDQNSTKAYSDIVDNTKWIAKVNNPNQVETVFTPIDNCIIVLKPGTKDKESTCDGMLTTSDTLYLVELKKQGTGGWIGDAIGQLENTVKLILANDDITRFKFKKGFACNRKHPSFTVIDNEVNKRFYKTYGFRLDIQAEIDIK